MAFSSSFADALNLGYDAATPKQDKNNKTAYQRYIEKFYGPGVTSHTDPVALARAATGAVERGLKTGAGFLGHAVSGLLGAPRGPERGGPSAPATPANRMYSNSAIGAGLSSADGSGSGYGGPSTGANSVGSRISSDLQRDFGLSATQAAGIVGNLGHESGGFTQYQERHPTKGIGGAGWAQWTGSRRTDFENYAKTNNLHPQSYEANYGFLKKELTGQYKGAIDAVKKANTVKDAVYAFEGTYEKANKKYVNYASRLQYANAYVPTNTNLTPAQQAAAAEAAGTATGATSGSLGSITDRGERVAAMQRDLNSRGANLRVDGLEGPQTRAAAQQFYGSPTSVRTPSFTASPATPANNWSSLQGSPTSTVNQRQDYVPTGSRTYTPQPSSYTSGRGDEGRGVNAPLSAQPRQVPTQAIDASGYPPIQNGFVRDARIPQPRPPQAPQPRPAGLQWSSLQGPYTDSTGGANAIVQQTARIPQHRPDYPAQQEAVPTNGITIAGLTQLLEDHGVPVHQIGSVISDIGSRAGNAFSEGASRNAGNNYSGGNYSGGSYGGSGGRSISSGVGGAFKNR